MARRYGKKRRHGRGSFTLPMAVVAPIAVATYSLGKMVMDGRGEIALGGITGVYQGKFDFGRFLGVWGPIGAGFGVHWLASKLGVNRALGRARVPIIRI